jgi:RNA polymerase sigma-70 factor (ECF subfamily)
LAAWKRLVDSEGAGGRLLDLVRRAQRGDHAAFDELAAQHAQDLFRLAVAIVGWELAPDVLQEALIRAWRELPTLRDPDRFRIWVRRIVVNLSRDALRARRRSRVLALEPALLRSSSTPDPATTVATIIDLDAAMDRLTGDQRAIVALHYQLGLPIREVALTLGIRDGTAKSRLNSALVVLRRVLGEPAR